MTNSAWAPFVPKGPFPVRRYGPNGQEAEFAKQEDVPPGWEDHPSKVRVSEIRESEPELVSVQESKVAFDAVIDSLPTRKPITLRRKTL